MRKSLGICCIVLLAFPAFAQVARHTGTSRVVGNRSSNGNVNVNSNVSVNRQLNVHGSEGAVVVEDNSWNWESFAAGAVTGAGVGAAANASTSTVVATPAVGTVVTALPGSCATMPATGGIIYKCDNT
ncbi:MAG TPA: hypothetical protein VE133_05385, partial [Candidatus Sulfotelmatobacter sp.]|nr:hypothetical protein [Candidatus Sulfotelmatobacter sp.]